MAQQNPFTPGGTGENAFKAAYDRLKQESELQKQNIGKDYSGAYQQLRQQGYGMGLGASAQKGLSGGQAAGVRGAIGAQQMEKLGNLMQGQEKAFREQKLGESSIYSNALLEGQQAQELERSNIQANLTTQQQVSTILADDKLTEQQKTDQLVALGVDPAKAAVDSGLQDLEDYGKLKNFAEAASSDFSDILKEHNNFLNIQGTANSNPAGVGNAKQKIIAQIEAAIVSARRFNPSLTRQQILNRMIRKGIPVQNYVTA